ncbi:hypothetical protein ColLi_08164 [Colletotrichum liriopes]|uniref:Uncharacterized protein n=1 Tax=Colletotrichum liriopes TaxID=708192 RepID=A0AA37GRZ0_9PEZI|nr:hypothetical protein ColLi_08164 [Colletotrichum liriopes]
MAHNYTWKRTGGFRSVREWEQLCLDPRRLIKNFPEDTLPSADGDRQYTTMHRQLQKDNISRFLEADKESPAASYQTLSQTPQAPSLVDYSTTSPASSPSTPRASPPPAVTYETCSTPTASPSDNNQSPGVVCRVAPCQGKAFNNIADLRSHNAKAHRYPCESGCLNVGYPSKRDRMSRHYGPSHGVGEKYTCGRCGKSIYRQCNHKRHLDRKQPCKAKPVAQEYVCGRCGDKTYNKEEHLWHLEQKGCKTKK